MEARAMVMLDGNEIDIMTRLLIKKSKEATLANKWQEAQQFIIIVDKLADAKEEFHRGHYEVFDKRYGFENEKTTTETVAK